MAATEWQALIIESKSTAQKGRATEENIASMSKGRLSQMAALIAEWPLMRVPRRRQRERHCKYTESTNEEQTSPVCARLRAKQIKPLWRVSTRGGGGIIVCPLGQGEERKT